MNRNIGSAHLVRVIATCGHEAAPYVPPHAFGGQPGPVGLRNIAKAANEPCFSCRAAAKVEGQFIAVLHFDGGGHNYLGPNTYLAVLNESKSNIAEDEQAKIVDLYVLPYDEDEHPTGDGDRSGEFFTYDRERDASILRYLAGNQVMRETQYPPRIAGASDTDSALVTLPEGSPAKQFQAVVEAAFPDLEGIEFPTAQRAIIVEDEIEVRVTTYRRHWDGFEIVDLTTFDLLRDRMGKHHHVWLSMDGATGMTLRGAGYWKPGDVIDVTPFRKTMKELVMVVAEKADERETAERQREDFKDFVSRTIADVAPSVMLMDYEAKLYTGWTVKGRDGEEDKVIPESLHLVFDFGTREQVTEFIRRLGTMASTVTA